jgi:RNA polymerase sigma-70 factor (sigma-E family)
MSVVEVEESLRAAYEEHYLSLLRLSILLSGERETAEDLAQEAFVRVANRLGDIPSERLFAYLRQVVVNLWRNRLRKLTRERHARARSALEMRSNSPGHEDRAALRTAVMALPARQRACLVLRYYEDLPEREVAVLLSCSVGTVKSHTSRALKRLRREFEDEP